MELKIGSYPPETLSMGACPGLNEYYNELKNELTDILSYWIHNTHDAVNGGFIGRVDEDNVKHPEAPKGAVLNSRILWAFSTAFQLTQNAEHLYLARIAFSYLKNNFIDAEHGGVFWSVDAKGQPLDTKKQVYAQAFAIYGCCAYYQASHNEAARELAIELYQLIENKSFDEVHGGYLEAFTRDWNLIGDMRLSAKDANEKKTMNTHLHVLEAYSSLYKIWPNELLKQQIKKLLKNFTEHIIDPHTGHLRLFFDEQWNSKSGLVSFGHDIEAAWLLLEAAKTIMDLPIEREVKILSQKIARATLEGLDEDGGMWYEYEPGSHHVTKEKHWWVQAETMIGFFDQWQLTGNPKDLERSRKSWQYAKEFIKDKVYGEWLWGRDEEGSIMSHQDKVGIWKCPYHNSRACIELLNRINSLIK
ncbi:MAG: AGE family epimerase/isomerase [Ferruginibacter sp.]